MHYSPGQFRPARPKRYCVVGELIPHNSFCTKDSAAHTHMVSNFRLDEKVTKLE